MPFDSKAFMRTLFVPREEAIKLPALKDWFGDDDECLWTVRGMTGSELARTLDAANKIKNMDAVIKAIGNSQETIRELKIALGMGDDTPADIAKRLEQLTVCSVEPKLEITVAVKLAEAFPVEFYMLTNKIVELTGLGMDVKKPPASGLTTASAT